jgi:hypothetical protein
MAAQRQSILPLRFQLGNYTWFWSISSDGYGWK